MRRNILIILTLIIMFMGMFYFTPPAHTRGCCSSHGGIDCDAGEDEDGSVICMDGWTLSKCKWSKECGESETKNNNQHRNDTSNNYIARIEQYKYCQKMENDFHRAGYNISVKSTDDHELWIDTSKVKNSDPKTTAHQLYNSARNDNSYIESLKKLEFVSVNYLYGNNIMQDIYKIDLDDY